MKKQTQAPENNPALPLGKRNYILILCGIAAIILGFILLSGGGSEDPATQFDYGMFNFRRLYIAPILLLVGFLFGLYAIMYRPKNKTVNAATEPSANQQTTQTSPSAETTRRDQELRKNLRNKLGQRKKETKAE